MIECLALRALDLIVQKFRTSDILGMTLTSNFFAKLMCVELDSERGYCFERELIKKIITIIEKFENIMK